MKPSPLVTAVAAPPVPAAARWKADYDGRLGPAIDLAQAVPGVPPPEALLERLAAAARDPANAGYGPIVGELALRSALASDMAAVYGASLETDDIVITPGCNQAFVVAVMALATRDHSVIVPTPWYFSHAMALGVLGVRAVPLPCRAEAGFVPSVDDARRLIDDSTRAILLITPNNPTGATYPPGVIAAFADLAREVGVALLLDETYRDFLPAGAGGQPHDLFADERWRDTLVHLYSFSKSYAVPGHRLGALVADPALLREVAKVLDCTTICPRRPGRRGVGGGRHPALARRHAGADQPARCAVCRSDIGRSGLVCLGNGCLFRLRAPSACRLVRGSGGPPRARGGDRDAARLLFRPGRGRPPALRLRQRTGRPDGFAHRTSERDSSGDRATAAIVSSEVSSDLRLGWGEPNRVAT